MGEVSCGFFQQLDTMARYEAVAAARTSQSRSRAMERRSVRQTELSGSVTKKRRPDRDEKKEVAKDARSKEELRRRRKKKVCPICYRSLVVSRGFRFENRIRRLFLSCKPNWRKAMAAAAASRTPMKKKATTIPKPSEATTPSPKPSEVKATSPSPKPSEAKATLANAESNEKGSEDMGMAWGGERMRKLVAAAEWKTKGNSFNAWGGESMRKMTGGERTTKTETWRFSASYLVLMRNMLPPPPDLSASNPFLRMIEERAAVRYKARLEFCDYVFSQYDVAKGYSEFEVEVADDGEPMVPAKFRLLDKEDDVA